MTDALQVALATQSMPDADRALPAEIKPEPNGRAKFAFLANMRHEFCTPLTAILGFAEIIHDELEGPIGNPVYREYAGHVLASGQQLLRLFDNAFDLLKAEANALELREDAIDIQQLLLACARLLSRRTGRTGVRIDVTAPTDLPLLWADVARVHQILLNLLTCVVDAAPRDDAVTVTVVVGVGADGALRITVQDAGTGVTPEDRARAISLWDRAGDAPQRRHVGTDLGLPRAKLLIERHGGRLDVTGGPGQRTCMTLVFPADRVRPAGRP